MRRMAAYLPRSRAARARRDRRPPAAPARNAGDVLRQVMRGSYSAHESLVTAALQYLALQKIPAIPIFTGPRVRPRPGGGFDLRANPLQLGFADIAAAAPPDGQLWLIECKTGRASRSPEQVELHGRFRAAGTLCIVIRNVLDLRPHVAHAWARAAGVVIGKEVP